MVNLYFESFRKYSHAVIAFRKSLYNQKHAFYFRAVSKWEERLNVSD